MYEWLLYFLTPVAPVMANAAPPEDYVGVVAVEAAYASLLPARVEPKPEPGPRPVDPNCGTCKGTGRVKSGDGQGWTKCPACQASAALPAEAPAAAEPMKKATGAPKQLFKQAPVQSVPPQTNCPDGKCPPAQQPQNTANMVPAVVPFGVRRLFRRR